MRERGGISKRTTFTGQSGTLFNGAPLGSTLNHAIEFQDGWYMRDQWNDLWCIPRLREKYGDLLDLGAPFDLLKVEWDFPICGMNSGNPPASGVHRWYRGPIIANPALYPFDMSNYKDRILQFAPVDPLDVRWGLGGQAIAACKPADPESMLAQTLIEVVRDGIPSNLLRFDVKNQADVFRQLGGNYLAVKFAWEPFVADIQDAARAITNQAQILDDLYRNNGRPIRRRYRFPETKTVDILETDVLPWPTLTTAHWSQSKRIQTTTRTKKTWFSGEFIYHLPPRSSELGDMVTRARHLAGLSLTPDILWELAPWSWLADYFASLGSLFSTLSAISSDNLVMPYGYLMQEANMVVETVHTNVKTLGYGTVNPTVKGTVNISQKTRVRASPYGFGFKPGDLTSRQWTILGALGMANDPRWRR